MASKQEISQLRRELEALRNQVKAYGGDTLKKGAAIKQGEEREGRENYGYVFYDLRASFMFILFALCFMLVVAIFVSSFPIFQHIRDLLHIKQLIL